jgi:hypothetical protein
MKIFTWGLYLSQLAGQAAAWQHVSEKALYEAVQRNEATLIACK